MPQVGWIAMIALASLASSAACRELDAGLTITEPGVLRTLDRSYGIGQMVPGGGAAEISNKDLFLLPAMQPVLATINADLGDEAKRPGEPGSLFDTKYLTTGYARFVLAGIVNRMDRAWAYADAASCGEIRFIYRLVYHVELTKLPGRFVDSYLPMTFNLVLRTRDPGDSICCADLAKRWLRMGDKSVTVESIMDRKEGPLVYADPTHVDRLELNMQSERWGASATGKKDFGGRADYILRVFKFDAAKAAFAPQRMENEVDRDRLLDPDNAALLGSLKTFLLDLINIEALDKGTIKIPDKYLALRGLSVAPGGAVRSANRILSDILNGADPDVGIAVAKAAAKFKLVNIRSAYGFQRRLDDISCSGCHQTHSAAGFHFMGIDWSQIHPNNTTQIAGSPHFFGDMPRRRDIVGAFAAGRRPDCTRGFAARPLGRHAQELKGTGLYDGWGGHCYRGDDASFTTWHSCSSGLTCKEFQQSAATRGFGLCLPKGRLEVGDPVEVGTITTSEFDEDTFSRTSPPQIERPSVTGRSSWMLAYFRRALKLKPSELASHQEYDTTDLTGAFPAGMLRLGTSTVPGTPCPDLTGYPEAIWGRLPVTGSTRAFAPRPGISRPALSATRQEQVFAAATRRGPAAMTIFASQRSPTIRRMARACLHTLCSNSGLMGTQPILRNRSACRARGA